MKTRIYLLTVLLLCSGAALVLLWCKSNELARRQQEQQHRFATLLLLQQATATNPGTATTDSLLQSLYNAAAVAGDSLVLQAISRLANQQPAGNNPLYLPASPEKMTVIRPAATGVTEKTNHQLEDSLKKIQVLLEMEKDLARSEIDRFRKMSDSLLTILENKGTETGILYFKSPQGINIRYVGEIKEENAHGFGMGLWDNGHKYEGQWQQNTKTGQGTYYFPNSEKFSGTFANNKRTGKGIYYFKNGDYYNGYWHQDVREGVGCIIGKNGKIKKAGEWKNDKLVVNRRLTDAELEDIR
ncbi:MAG TPA: hypothetical protein PKE63_05950 [Lacibacter sp.]|nr:hypothetical protein [Lacibacter sp.]HMO88812.1 hypothetical protein [Lacibacter sp.]HMP86801.1 hypothetical protein [Lacibacter sp.]